MTILDLPPPKNVLIGPNLALVKKKKPAHKSIHLLLYCRENSFSPDFEDFEFSVKKFEEDIDASDDSGHGRSTQMSGPHSLSSSAPR
jgi:hypothetical protein